MKKIIYKVALITVVTNFIQSCETQNEENNQIETKKDKLKKIRDEIKKLIQYKTDKYISIQNTASIDKIDDIKKLEDILKELKNVQKKHKEINTFIKNNKVKPSEFFKQNDKLKTDDINQISDNLENLKENKIDAIIQQTKIEQKYNELLNTPRVPTSQKDNTTKYTKLKLIELKNKIKDENKDEIKILNLIKKRNKLINEITKYKNREGTQGMIYLYPQKAGYEILNNQKLLTEINPKYEETNISELEKNIKELENIKKDNKNVENIIKNKSQRIWTPIDQKDSNIFYEEGDKKLYEKISEDLEKFKKTPEATHNKTKREYLEKFSKLSELINKFIDQKYEYYTYKYVEDNDNDDDNNDANDNDSNSSGEEQKIIWKGQQKLGKKDMIYKAERMTDEDIDSQISEFQIMSELNKKNQLIYFPLIDNINKNNFFDERINNILTAKIENLNTMLDKINSFQRNNILYVTDTNENIFNGNNAMTDLLNINNANRKHIEQNIKYIIEIMEKLYDIYIMKHQEKVPKIVTTSKKEFISSMLNAQININSKNTLAHNIAEKIELGENVNQYQSILNQYTEILSYLKSKGLDFNKQNQQNESFKRILNKKGITIDEQNNKIELKLQNN